MKDGAKKVERFEDLFVWQKARHLTKAAYLSTGQPAFAKDYGLCNQVQRAAVSVMSNIAEGFERGGRAEFNQFLLAKASCAELRSQLYVGLDVGHLGQPDFDKLFLQAEEVSKLLSRLKSSVQKQKGGQKGQEG
ncbi:MAG: four helix bundle protein [Thermaceae bacterium]|nr:four helix bundle protein [Thermaceae bacterium]